MSDSQPRSSGLWRNRDFLKLWSGETVSDFGSLISGVAIPFAAILTLDADGLLEIAAAIEAPKASE